MHIIKQEEASGTHRLKAGGLAKRLAQHKFLSSGLLAREAAVERATFSSTLGCHPSPNFYPPRRSGCSTELCLFYNHEGSYHPGSDQEKGNPLCRESLW